MKALPPVGREISLPKVAIPIAWASTALIVPTFIAGMCALPKTVVIPLMISFSGVALASSITALIGSGKNWCGRVLSHVLAILFISVVLMVILLPFAPILNRIFGMKEIVPVERVRTEATP